MVVYFIIFALFGYIYEDSDSLIVDNDSLIICGDHQYNMKVHITNSGKLKVRQWGYEDTLGWLLLNAPLISIEDSSSITGSEFGYWGGSTTHANGFGPGYGGSGPSGGGGGGAYGGDGGDGGDTNPGSGGSSYGDPSDTLIDIGSGGGAGRITVVDGWGGDGGAEVKLRAQKILIDSSYIKANGQRGNDGGTEAGGGGAGGGIMVWADSVAIHYSELTANGGDGGNASFGGGGGAGGGRIKIFYVFYLDTTHLTLSVQGGAGGSGGFSNGQNGSAGSVHIEELIGIREIVHKANINNMITTNPIRNRIKVTVEAVPIKLNLYDISGRLVKTFRFTHTTEVIDLHDLNQGVYFLKSEGDKKTVGKIILLK